MTSCKICVVLVITVVAFRLQTEAKTIATQPNHPVQIENQPKDPYAAEEAAKFKYTISNTQFSQQFPMKSSNNQQPKSQQAMLSYPTPNGDFQQVKEYQEQSNQQQTKEYPPQSVKEYQQNKDFQPSNSAVEFNANKNDQIINEFKYNLIIYRNLIDYGLEIYIFFTG